VTSGLTGSPGHGSQRHVASDATRALDSRYEKSFQIRLDEIDFNGHLHSTKYLEYASHTRYCQLVDAGWDLRTMQEHSIGAVVLSDEIRYLREVLLGEPVTVAYQITGYSRDSKYWRSRIQVVRSDGTVAATVTSNGAWFGLQSRRIETPPPKLVSATDSIRSSDFTVLENPRRARS
jgi:acyl-CoA thioester hydrolase